MAHTTQWNYRSGILIYLLVGMVLSQLLTAASAEAQSKKVTKPTLVSSDDLKATTIEFKFGKKFESHEIVCFGSTPGTARDRSNGVLFTPFSHTLKTLRNNSRTKKIRLDRARALQKNGKIACTNLSAPPISQPTPMPTPLPSPEPTTTPVQPSPTATPTPAPANFLDNGDVTSAGKTIFGIPQNLAANKFTGQGILQNRCLGCHNENGQFSSFDYLRQKIAEPPMSFTQTTLPDEELAHLIAWLNRFNP